ncbi:MAG: hypothetical protein OHK0012_10560 [Synechococcales cyanobacterium]
MPAAYSYDLRKKALDAVKRGTRKTDVCRLLGISRNTLDLWLKREVATGDFRALRAPGRRPKINDLEQFRSFLREHSDKTQQQLADLWGKGVTQQNVSNACRKLRILRKGKSAPSA